jgi:murein DD-endopeptidase MepM/ murein hydrolase activator NlpD
MRRRFVTILFLKHAGARFRQVRLSYPFVAAAVLIAGTLVLAGLVAPGLLLRVRETALSVDRLAQENARLNAERNSFEAALQDMTERLSEFEDRATLLAEELGVEAIPSPAGGAGGDGTEFERYWFDEEVRGLRERTVTLDRSLDDLDAAFEARISQLAATPSLMPVEGWFSHGYGWRKDPFTGEREFHHGMDIVAPLRTQVVAPADGVVARSGRFAELGKSLDLAHGFGFVTRYAHLHEIHVKPGDRVRRGAVIGLVGSTGRSTGPHLHYEVFRDGRRVNPWGYLGQAD